MTASALLLALEPVVDELEALGVRYYVAGSLASSAHGVPRSSIDADVVAELREAHVERLVARLQGAFYIDEGRVRAAVLARRSFNAIHLATMFKIDMLKTGDAALDYPYLARWAKSVAVGDLLDRARAECGPHT